MAFADGEVLAYILSFLRRAHDADLSYIVRDGVNILRYAMKVLRRGEAESAEEAVLAALELTLPAEELDALLSPLIARSVPHPRSRGGTSVTDRPLRSLYLEKVPARFRKEAPMISSRRRRALPIFLLAVVLLPGCVSSTLEFDRMQGTAFPTSQSLGGETWDLEKIFFKGGTLVVVDEDDTNISPLTTWSGQKECITNAELDSLMTSNRQSQVGSSSFPCGFWIFNRTCTRYHAYGIVADHFATYNSGSCKKLTLGRMWDSTDRSAFAIYYQHSTIQSDGKKYLRTTAHELGHAFNLHHQDGDGSDTVMNTTGTVGSSFTYDFSEDSQEHLKEHEAECRFPGTGGFYDVNGDHQSWHGGTAVTCP